MMWALIFISQFESSVKLYKIDWSWWYENDFRIRYKCKMAGMVCGITYYFLSSIVLWNVDFKGFLFAKNQYLFKNAESVSFFIICITFFFFGTINFFLRVIQMPLLGEGRGKIKLSWKTIIFLQNNKRCRLTRFLLLFIKEIVLKEGKEGKINIAKLMFD